MSDIKEIENLMRAIGKGDSNNPDTIDHKLINADALFEKYSKEFRETPNALTRTKLLMIIEAMMFWTSQSKKVFSLTEEF
jgi:hypothetical protein|tara:strand:- start:2535 stop:2774 length:240 start_codon:yes stop_codon:yes gene_type:complete